jgi:hypothetical protein
VNNPILNRNSKNMKTQNSRNPIDRSPLRSGLLFIALALGYFALSPAPNAFGVVPAPDGGYPGFNTAEGQNALLHLTTGTANTAVGWVSLENVTTASFNTGIGAGTLVLNSGDQNTATGAAALLLNTTGGFNTANGALALLNNTEASGNTANGDSALFSNTTGNSNTATGDRALRSNTAGEVNTATGSLALFSNTTGNFNTAIGDSALENSTTGDFNTALGASAGINVITASNVIAIGNVGADVSDSCFIGNIRGKTTAQNNAVPILIDSAGQLGTMSSSRRFKREIKPMDHTSEAILALNPVTFHYKSDSTGTPQFGLIAEEVAQVNPDLVVRDENGEIYTVRYEAVNAMLLNEFLKEHRKVQEQEATIAQLKANDAAQLKEIKALAATLKEQASEIQKVSAQLELQKAAPQTVLNNQ